MTISRSFQIRHRNEIIDFGSYRPGILFGSFDKEDTDLIFAFCERCDYIAELADSSSKTIKVENKMTGKWGWIKKLWACIDPESDLFSAQFVYGFFSKGRWRTKYCINDNIIRIGERIIAQRIQDTLDNTNWPYVIYLPELEPDQVREKIAIIRGSVKKCFA